MYQNIFFNKKLMENKKIIASIVSNPSMLSSIHSGKNVLKLNKNLGFKLFELNASNCMQTIIFEKNCAKNKYHSNARNNTIISERGYIRAFHTNAYLNQLPNEESPSLKSFRKKHEKHVQEGRSSSYYEKKLRIKEKNEKKKSLKHSTKNNLIEEADKLLNKIESKKPSSSLSDKKKKREILEEKEKEKKIERFEEMMKRKLKEEFLLRNPKNGSQEYAMPLEMRDEFLKDYYESGNKKWISSEERQAKFFETLQLIGSEKLTPFNCIKIFDRKVKKYSLHLRVQDYITLLTPLARNGFLEKTLEIYSRMKYFDKIKIDESIMKIIMRSISEVTPENERVIAITNDDLLVLRKGTSEIESDTVDELNQNNQVKTLIENDADINQSKKSILKSDGVNHIKCVAKAHDLLNKDCVKYSIPLTSTLITEFIRILGMHGQVKKANTIFKLMLRNMNLNSIASQENDTMIKLNNQNYEALSHLLEEIGEKADDQLVNVLNSKSKPTTQKKNMVIIEGDPNLIPNKYTYGVIIECLGSNGDIVNAIKIFDKIPLPYKRIPAFNAIFGALNKNKQNYHSKMMEANEKNLDFTKTVIQYFQELIKLKLNPTIHTFSLILQCIPERSNDIYKEMKVQNIEPDELLLGQFLNELIAHNHFDEAMNEVLPKVKVGSIPKGVLYKLFQQIVANDKLENIKQITPLLEFMVKSGMKDLKLDPKLKEFFILKRKFKLLKDLEQEFETKFTEKYIPSHKRVDSKVKNSLEKYENLDSNEHDSFIPDENIKENNTKKILRLKTSNTLNSFNLKKYEEQI